MSENYISIALSLKDWEKVVRALEELDPSPSESDKGASWLVEIEDLISFIRSHIE